ncbi:hypothetical protein GGI07_003534 [Coemansia sp. Benny D115]|nr:hypothetical protein GGI07_003534 [Coemansia sp. Benny D115]
MSSKVLSGRRKVFPVESRPVVVPGYQLTFDMVGFPYIEPGFGTIQPIEHSKPEGEAEPLAEGRKVDCQVGSPLHCIAHLITQKEMEHIINTEGGNGNPDFGYQLVDIACTTYDGQEIRGKTLIDVNTKLTGYHPSARYRKILIDGAEEHGLAAEYLERLRLVRPFVAATVGQRVAKALTLAVGLPLVMPVFLFAFASLALKTKTPRAVSVYGEHVKRLTWVLHDWVLAPIFGKGC